MGKEDNIAAIKKEAQDLVTKAREAGLILNIESTPDKPFAMGHYHEEVTVRQSRPY